MQPLPSSASRHEDKFLIHPAKLSTVMGMLNSHAQKDKHTGADGSYTVTSLYFDTPNFRCYRDHQQSLSKRFKARVRWYQEQEARHLELKIKHGRLIHKISHLFAEDSALLEDPSYIQTNLPRTFHPYLLTQPLKRLLTTSYQRHAYVLGSARITIDTHLAYATVDQRRHLKDPSIVLEIKTLCQYPLPLQRLLSEQTLERVSFSKYVNAVKGLHLA